MHSDIMFHTLKHFKVFFIYEISLFLTLVYILNKTQVSHGTTYFGRVRVCEHVRFPSSLLVKGDQIGEFFFFCFFD